MTRYLSAVAAVLLWLSAAHAQYYGQDPSDPKFRRAERERAVARLGEVARKLVEEHDAAVKATDACSLSVAKKLAGFHNDPDGLSRLPRPNDFLRVVADRKNGGDEVVLWAMEHRELRDPDAFDAFLAEPLEYSLGLKQILRGAAEFRARRLAAPDAGTELWQDPAARRGLLVIGGAALLVFVCWLARKRREPRGGAGPADDYVPRPPARDAR